LDSSSYSHDDKDYRYDKLNKQIYFCSKSLYLYCSRNCSCNII
jgi:hypothetical protein